MTPFSQSDRSPLVPASRPVQAVIVGAGNRSMLYASYALTHPDELLITAVVDPDPVRRRRAADRFGLPDDRLYASVEELVAGPKLADAAINGTMDSFHVATTIPLLHAGYDVLLEKPIGVSEAEVLELYEASRATGRTVFICHVLRYAPFYAEIRRRIENGDIGEVVAIQTEENVSYHHMATAFVRGKWSNLKAGGSSMLMQKCCHDLDIVSWMKGSVRPVRVSSFGSLYQFRSDKAPEGAGTRCLADCPIESECAYSAGSMYIEKKLWSPYVWAGLPQGNSAADEQKIESLRTDNPYGRCVWRSDNDVVDHQSVIIEFEDGSTASHSLTGGTSKPCRTIHITGTKGEIVGTMEEGSFKIRHPDRDGASTYQEELVELKVSADMHGGGDMRLVTDFIRTLRGEEPSISSTSLDRSIYGHQIGFSADRARLENRVVEIRELSRELTAGRLEASGL
ncbi:Gfo/Idh/MocA family oxidoreductase [Paenibacillus sp. GYB004]|uniref:Gfo/Idh/MocA family protein n=1 Tax=Paenibacillus sp. GYB004 TaxID=2994393 RepID=UPI002F96E381